MGTERTTPLHAESVCGVKALISCPECGGHVTVAVGDIETSPVDRTARFFCPGCDQPVTAVLDERRVAMLVAAGSPLSTSIADDLAVLERMTCDELAATVTEWRTT